jgi:hypothetical protein
MDTDMSKDRIEQVRLTHRGRQFHFVSYEGQPGNPARQVPATIPAWYLMSSGKRWEAVPHRAGQDQIELEGLLTEWLEAHIFN